MIKDEAYLVTFKFFLRQILVLNQKVAVLGRILRSRGVSVAELDEAEAWAENLLRPSLEAVEQIQTEDTNESVEDLLRKFSGPIQ